DSPSRIPCFSRTFGALSPATRPRAPSPPHRTLPAARSHMPPDTSLIATIVAGLVLAFVLGAVANRLKLPPLVGYLIAGIIVGPHTPGLGAAPELVGLLAEIGLVLLLFGVGLQVSLRDLMAVRALPLVGALVQLAGTTLLGLGLGLLLGWGLGGGLVLGLALAVAS